MSAAARSTSAAASGGCWASAASVMGRSAGGSLRVMTHHASTTSRITATRKAIDDPPLAGEGIRPRRSGRHPEDALLDDVGRVQLRDVDPPLLGQLDDDPDERRDADGQARADAPGVPTHPDGLDGVEEVFEGVGEDEQQRPDARSPRTPARPPVGSSTGTSSPGTRPGWSSCAASRGRRSTGSRCRAPCHSPGTRRGRHPGASAWNTVWSTASMISAAIMAGSGQSGMSRGTRKRDETIATPMKIAQSLTARSYRGHWSGTGHRQSDRHLGQGIDLHQGVRPSQRSHLEHRDGGGVLAPDLLGRREPLHDVRGSDEVDGHPGHVRLGAPRIREHGEHVAERLRRLLPQATRHDRARSVRAILAADHHQGAGRVDPHALAECRVPVQGVGVQVAERHRVILQACRVGGHGHSDGCQGVSGWSHRPRAAVTRGTLARVTTTNSDPTAPAPSMASPPPSRSMIT